MANTVAMNLRELSHLVDEIVTAPYAVSLTSPHYLIRQQQTQHTPQVLETWTPIKACQIDSLAAAVLADLSRHRSTLRVLAAFIVVQAFRDAILRQKPEILGNLIELALRKDGYSSIAFQASAAILASPLPPTFLVTAWIHKFFGKVVESVVEAPCSESTTVLRRLVTSFPKLLETLPEILISNLADKSKCILSSKEAHLANLNCMSIAGSVLKTFYVDSGTSSCLSTPSPSFLSTWATKAYQLYVQGPKVSDNIKNKMLRAILFNKPQNGTSENETKEVFQSVVQILEMIEPKFLLQWGNDNQEFLQMLLQKAVRDDLFTSSRFYAFAILTKIDPRGSNCDYLPLFGMLANAVLTEPSESLEASLARVLEQTLVNDVFRGLESNLSSIPRACDSQACISLVKQIFEFVLEQCRAGQTPNLATSAKLRNVSLIAHAMRGIFELSSPSTLAGLVIEVVNEIGIPDWWKLSLVESYSSNCARLEICSNSLERCRLELTHSVSDFVVKAASTTSRSIGLRDFQLVFDQIANAESLGPKRYCKYHSFGIETTIDRSLSLAETAEISDWTSLGWKEHLDYKLQRSSSRSQQILVDYITDICSDLQNRCDNVEIPLRALEAEATNLQEELHAAQEKNGHAQKELELQQTGLRSSELKYSSLGKVALLTKENAEVFKKDTAIKFEQMELDFKLQLMKASDDLMIKSKDISRLEVDMMWLNSLLPLLHQELRDAHEVGFVQLRQLHDGQLTALRAECSGLQGHLDTVNEQLAGFKSQLEASREELREKMATIDALAEVGESWQLQRAELEKSLEVSKEKYARILAAISP